MTRNFLTRGERRTHHRICEQNAWNAMTPAERDAKIMRAMNDALDRSQSVQKRDLQMAGIPADAIDARFRTLLPIVIASRTEELPVMGAAE